MPIFANVSSTPITPPAGVDLIEPRYHPSTGIHDDLFARALALNDGSTSLVIVTLDLVGLDALLVQAIRGAVLRLTGLPAERLMLTTTHTHSAPLTIPWGFLAQARRNRSWEAEMVVKVAATVDRALKDMHPVGLFSGRAPAQVGVNRRLSLPNGTEMRPNPAGPVAPWVDILRVDNLTTGKPLAVLFSHAAHAVTVHIAGSEVSADYPGYAARALSNSLGGAEALFAQGCGADINVDPLAGGHEAARQVGERLAEAAYQACQQASPVPPALLKAVLKEVRLPFRPLNPAVTAATLERAQQGLVALHAAKADAYALEDQRELVLWAEKINEASAHGGMDGLPFTAQGFRLGENTVLLGLSHEVFVDYQLWLEEHSPFLHTQVLGYTNGCEDYIPTAEAFSLGGYEVQGAPKYYGWPDLDPSCEQIVKDTAMGTLLLLKKA